MQDDIFYPVMTAERCRVANEAIQELRALLSLQGVDGGNLYFSREPGVGWYGYIDLRQVVGDVGFAGPVTFNGAETFSSTSSLTLAAGSTATSFANWTISGGNWYFPVTSNAAVAPAAQLVIPYLSTGTNPTYTPPQAGALLCNGKDLYQANPGSAPFSTNWEKYLPVSADGVTNAVPYIDSNGRVVPTSTTFTYTPGTNTVKLPTATTTGPIIIGTFLTYTEGTHVTLTTNTNNLTLPTTSLIGISTGGSSYDLTGVVAPTGPVATTITFFKTDTGTLTLKNLTTSTGTNQLQTTTGTDIPITQGQTFTMTYVPSLGKWLTTPTGVSSSGLTSPLTTTGDIWVYTSTDDRLPIGGTDGWALMVDSGASAGMSWQPVTATPGGPTTSLQFDNGGSLGGAGNFLYDGTSVTAWTGVGGASIFRINSVSGFQILPSGAAPSVANAAVLIDGSGFLYNDTVTYPAGGYTTGAKLTPGGVNGSIVIDSTGRITSITNAS